VSRFTPSSPLERLPLVRRIAFKQARAALLIALVIGVVLSLIQVAFDYEQELNELDASVSRLVSSNRPAAAEAVWTLNRKLARGVVYGLAGYRPVSVVGLETSTGTVLAHIDRSADGGGGDTWSRLFHRAAHVLFADVREIEVPLMAPDPTYTESIGVLRLTVAPEVIAAGFFRRSGLVILSGLVRNVALAFLLFGVFYLMVTRPLTRITERVVAINPRKLAEDTEESLKQPTGDEFEVLGEAISNLIASGRGYMTETIKAKRDLQEANRTLEDRVKERTRELESAVGALENLAVTDSLTNVFNRRFFVDVLGKAMSLRKRQPDDRLSVLMADIDVFKNVNDTHGHAAGDAVLCEMAAILKSQARESDTVARLGGEEFAVLLPDTNAEQAAQLAERVREEVDDHVITFRNQGIRITVSIGVAEASDSLDTADSLLHAADLALYEAKEAGRNRVTVFAA
jgi:diguanylate cyclase (GGDEF)-like protein